MLLASNNVHTMIHNSLNGIRVFSIRLSTSNQFKYFCKYFVDTLSKPSSYFFISLAVLIDMLYKILPFLYLLFYGFMFNAVSFCISKITRMRICQKIISCDSLPSSNSCRLSSLILPRVATCKYFCFFIMTYYYSHFFI